MLLNYLKTLSTTLSSIGIVIGSLVVVFGIFFICYGGYHPSIDEKYNRFKILFSGLGIVGFSLLYRLF